MSTGLTSLADCNGLGSDPGAVGVGEAFINHARDSLYVQQHGCCARCGRTFAETNAARLPHVDHDHECCPGSNRSSCGACIRGLLCAWCNLSLEIDAEAGEPSAIAYLNAPRPVIPPMPPRWPEPSPEVLRRLALVGALVYVRGGGPIPRDLAAARDAADAQLLDLAGAGANMTALAQAIGVPYRTVKYAVARAKAAA